MKASAPAWEHTEASISRRLDGVVPRRVIAPLLRRHAQVEVDDGACEPARTKLFRTIERFVSTGEASRAESLAALSATLDTDPDVLPDVEDAERFIFDHFALCVQAPHRQRGLIVSAPCARPKLAGVSIVKRYLQSDGRVVLKLRVGAYVDTDRSLWWELGIAAATVADAPGRSAARLPIPLSAMSRAVAGLAWLAAGRGACSIDLTPAHYGVLALSVRLGSVPEDPARLDRLVASIDRALSSGGAGRIPRARAVWLMENGRLTDPLTGQRVCWEPPRFVYPVGGERSARDSGSSAHGDVSSGSSMVT